MLADIKLDKHECIKHIGAYNAGNYKRKPNLELDREGYALFAGGLPESPFGKLRFMDRLL